MRLIFALNHHQPPPKTSAVYGTVDRLRRDLHIIRSRHSSALPHPSPTITDQQQRASPSPVTARTIHAQLGCSYFTYFIKSSRTFRTELSLPQKKSDSSHHNHRDDDSTEFRPTTDTIATRYETEAVRPEYGTVYAPQTLIFHG